MKISGISTQLKKLLILNYDSLIASYERVQFRRLNHSSNNRGFPSAEDVLNQPYVFVLSTGRCGTRLITNILSASPRLRVEHNPKPELEYVSSVIHRDNVCREALKIGVLAARFDLFFLDTLLRGKIYVETNNRISFFAPALAELLPNSKFIHLVRNPADFVRSGMRRGYYTQDVVQYQRLDGSCHFTWNAFSRMEKVAWEWNEINLKIEDFKTDVDANRVLTVNSECLYKESATTFSIFDFIGVKNPFSGQSGCKALKKMLAKPVNKQEKGMFPKYSDWSETDKRAFQRIVTLASKYGYSYL